MSKLDIVEMMKVATQSMKDELQKNEVYGTKQEALIKIGVNITKAVCEAINDEILSLDQIVYSLLQAGLSMSILLDEDPHVGLLKGVRMQQKLIKKLLNNDEDDNE